MAERGRGREKEGEGGAKDDVPLAAPPKRSKTLSHSPCDSQIKRRIRSKGKRKMVSAQSTKESKVSRDQHQSIGLKKKWENFGRSFD